MKNSITEASPFSTQGAAREAEVTNFLENYLEEYRSQLSGKAEDLPAWIGGREIAESGLGVEMIAELAKYMPYGEAVLQVAQYVCVLDENSRQSHLLS